MLNVAWADLVGIVQQFGQRQLVYTSTGDQSKLTSITTLNLDAYAHVVAHPGVNAFVSFCVDPNDVVYAGTTYTAHLDYNATAKTTSNSNGVALTNGVAWLYATFVTTNDFGTLVAADYTAFQQTVNSLVNQTPFVSNRFTAALLANLSEAEARATYQVGDSDITGGYAVFVVQLANGAAPAQDFIYVVGNSSPVPEPATILLWTLGSFGAFGAAWLKKRRNVTSQLA
ncbi:MAG: PEP-CTERM sorting domain-containing protein [Planctomycetaceae bacterium]|nr:PEP-CTERM sorting domain-containing protein [Planctomycetaceae bacterium]